MYKIPANTLFMGHSLVFMPECHSTNDEASHIIQRTGAIDGAVIITDNQTSGRGQRNTIWVAEPGKNLTFSIILKPSFLLVKNQFQLNVSISLGIADYLKKALGEEIKIKWPNDIMVGGKKICGVLIENHLSGNQIQYCVVGIGLNVNQDQIQFERATTMKQVGQKEFSLEVELPQLLKCIESRYLMLRDGHQQKLVSEYLDLMYWRNEMHTFSANEKRFEGEVTGIDDIGRLQVRVKDETQVFGVKELEYLH